MTIENAHYPVEIFGYPIDNKTEVAMKHRRNYHCPFLGGTCNKQSRLIDYPMGICSVLHGGNKIPICPQRFLQKSQVFKDVCNNYFGDTNNILLFSEIGLRNVGNFDFVLVKHEPISNKIEDFCVVEFQTDSTTRTGALVESLNNFMDNKDITQQRYEYGMNTYNTIKLSFTQMTVKGQVLEKWNKKIFWIEPVYVFENMVRRFNLRDLEYDENDKTVFFTYDLVKKNGIYELKKIYQRSSSVLNLLQGFTDRPTPEIDHFIKILEQKINLNLNLAVK